MADSVAELTEQEIVVKPENSQVDEFKLMHSENGELIPLTRRLQGVEIPLILKNPLSEKVVYSLKIDGKHPPVETFYVYGSEKQGDAPEGSIVATELNDEQKARYLSDGQGPDQNFPIEELPITDETLEKLTDLATNPRKPEAVPV